MAESQSLNVLIVEDDSDTQSNLQDILELEGYQSESAACASEVVDHEDLQRFDVILLDRHLPDGTADELLPHIKAQAPRAAVVLVTGYADTGAAVTALRHGAADFLTKPIEPDVLRKRLSQIHQQICMQQELVDTQRRLLQAERLAAIGQTITALSHEARNELSCLKMGLNLLPHVLDDPDTTQETIEKLIESEERLNRLFEDVRGFAGPIHLERVTCSIDPIWRKAWSRLHSLRKGRQVQFEEQIGEGELILSLDAFRLEQVFRNLFENSLAACADPVILTVSCEPPSDGCVVIVVRDNGPGLASNQKQKIFEPFFTTKSRGTGLGMAIVQRIIQAHCGTIVAGDAVAGGAEFTITLPLADPAIGCSADDAAAAAPFHHELSGIGAAMGG